MESVVDKKYRSGHPVIDFQHRLLIIMITKLKSSLKAGRSMEVLEEAAQFFDCFIVEHFNDEEELQRESDYPNYEVHKQQHTEMREDFLRIKAKIDKRGANHILAVESLTLISEWMNKHFKEMDKEFIDHLKEYMKRHQKKNTPNEYK
ncbi:MAG: hypothetical protein GY839_05880 [candidate division Zixibacteria bacterium]|nr:hypothetical protein [candidate division Zixibacteria bacterium]